MIGSNGIIEFNTSGVSATALTPEEVVKKKLKFMLETNKGDIPTDPEYGADLIYFAHKPITSAMKSSLMLAIKMAIAQYMPYVNVTALKDLTVKDRLRVVLEYSLTEGFEDQVELVI